MRAEPTIVRGPDGWKEFGGREKATDRGCRGPSLDVPSSVYRGLNYSDPFGLCPDPNKPWCSSPAYAIMRFFGASDATADKWSGILYGGAMIAGAPGNGMAVRGAAGAAAASAAARTAEVGVGTTVYRVYGGQSKQMGTFWTTANPSATPDFAAKAGLPAENQMTNVVEGVITDMSGVKVTQAAPGARGPGGINEVQIPDAAKQVKVTDVKPYDQ
jgi:hypothetical protein